MMIYSLQYFFSFVVPLIKGRKCRFFSTFTRLIGNKTLQKKIKGCRRRQPFIFYKKIEKNYTTFNKD